MLKDLQEHNKILIQNFKIGFISNNVPVEHLHVVIFCHRDGTDRGTDSCATARESIEIPGRQILSHNTGSCTASAGAPCGNSHVL